MAEQEVKFRKPNTNFKAILDRQRKEEEDEKFAISDALQEYIGKQTKDAGYLNEEKLQDAGIRQEVINFVDNYTISNLDGLKGADYDEALQTQKSTEKQVEELFKLKGDAKLSDAERTYIETTVSATNKKLGEILGVSTRLKLAFRDFKKELKPLKLAARIGLTNIPIIGKRIERAIRAEEEGEAEALRIKRGLRKREVRGARKQGDMEVAETQTESETQQTKTQAKQATAQVLGMNNKRPEVFRSKEQAVEEERESDTQFETTSNILERILEESELTNELLGGKKGKKGAGGGDDDGKDGFSILEVLGMKKLYDFVKAGRVGTLVRNLGALSRVAGLFTLATGAGIGLGKLIESIGMSNVGPEEEKVVNRQSRDITSSANFEGVLEDDMNLEGQETKEAQLKDEYNRGISEGKLPKDMTFKQYTKAKQDAGITRELKFEGFMGTGLFKESNLAKADADYGAITAQFSENQVNDMIVPPSVKASTESKIGTANTIQADGVEKGSQIINNSNNSGNTIINNQNNVDSSNTTNKTDYNGAKTIGTNNNAGFSDFY